MTDHDHPHDAHEHAPPYSLYIKVAVALVVLTGLSYWTYTPLWPTWLVGDSVEVKRLWMMAVSCGKASLVIMVFMHLWWEAGWKWVLTVPASCMCVFLTLALVPDVGMRLFNGFAGYSRERLVYSAELPEPMPQADQEHTEEHVEEHEEVH
jgi:cytochrome c oxidase subunit 4